MKRISNIFILIILIALIVSLSPCKSYAQNARRFRTDISFNMDWMKNDSDHLSDGDINNILIALDAGYFITNWLEIGPEVSYLSTELGKIDTTIWSFVGKANIHFLTDSQISPYFGLRLGFGSVDTKISIGDASVTFDDTAFTYGIQTGLNYFLTDNLSLNPEIRYTLTSFDGELGKIKEDIDSDDLTFTIGFGLYF